MKKDNSKTKGYALAEVLVALGFLGIVTTFFVTGSTIYRNVSSKSQNQSQATVLAREGLEVVRHIRDSDFSNLIDGMHGLATSSDEWSLSGGSNLIGDFSREITISSIDDNTKLIESRVSWYEDSSTSTVSMIEYLTDWQAEIIEDVEMGDWSTTTIASTINHSGNDDGIGVQVVGDYAYVIRAGGSHELSTWDISDPENPVFGDSMSFNGSPTDMEISGNYAYISSTGRELQIADISDPLDISLEGELNLSSNSDGMGIDVVGSYVYMARKYDSKKNGFEFNIIDISNPSNPSLVGSYDDSNGTSFYDVYVNGDHAYVTSSSNSSEIFIMDISDPSNPTVAAQENISGNRIGYAITGTIGKLFFGTSSGYFYTIDSSDPVNLSVLDSMGTGQRINKIDLGVNNTYAFLATDTNSAEFQIIDITDASNIATLLERGDFSADLRGVFYVSDGDYIVIVGEDNSAELQIIYPG